MGNSFIVFGDKRIKLSIIKKYEPSVVLRGTRFDLKIFYSVGQKPQFDTVSFDLESDLNEALKRLDSEFGIA